MPTYYVRPAGAHSNTEDGLTYDTAWLGWGNVTWGAGAGNVSASDTLYIAGTHTFTGANMTLGASGAGSGTETTLRGDYPGDAGTITFATSGLISWGRSHFKLINITVSQPLSSSAIFLAAIDNTEFNGVTITGGTIGISMTGADTSTHSNLTITNCNISGQSTDGIRFLASGTNFTTTLDTITITDNTISDITEDGISLRFESDQNAASKMSSLTITGNTMTGIGRFVIRVSDEVTTGTPTSEDCIINNNTITSNGDESDTSGGAISLRGFGDSVSSNNGNLTINGNTISDQYGNGGAIDIFYCKGMNIENNTIDNMITTGIDGNGILLDFGNSDTIVRRNNIANCLGLAGSAANHNSGCAIMVLYSNSTFTITGNFSNNTAHGVLIGNTASGAISGDCCNNTHLNCSKNGILMRATNAAPEDVHIKNCAFTETSGFTARPVYDDSGAATDVDEDYNTFFGFSLASLNHTDGTNNDTLDPLLGANNVPASNSPAIGTGVKWWSGANPIGYTGEPFSDFDTDRYHIQSTFSPFHPKNL